MTWAKFDDGYPLHPKMVAAGVDGLALDVAAICYSNRFGTDGFIPDNMLSGLFPPVKSPRKVAAKLIAVGRWERDDDRGGYVIHDHGEYNPSAAQVEAEREAARKRMRELRSGKGKSRSGNVRANTPRTTPARSPEVRDPRPDVPSEHNARPKRGEKVKGETPAPQPPDYQPPDLADPKPPSPELRAQILANLGKAG